jgi:hypothetical protein
MMILPGVTLYESEQSKKALMADSKTKGRSKGIVATSGTAKTVANVIGRMV